MDLKTSDRSMTSQHAVAYAIGDIHGRLDLLERLLQELRMDAARIAVAGARAIVIFLGDYIDRGPDARGVLSQLLAFRDESVCDVRFLRGNHEQLLLDVIDGKRELATWRDCGGLPTLRSYETIPTPLRNIATASGLRDYLRTLLPATHIDFLRETALFYTWGDYVFAHAGLKPDRLLTEQSETTLLWRRHTEVARPAHGKIVVHGHTPGPKPFVGRWRIAIDTEAYASGLLTAVRIEGDERRFLKISASKDQQGVTVTDWKLQERA